MMRRSPGLASVVLLFPLTLSATAQSTDQRLDAVERRLAEMEQRHQAELKARDETIERLTRQLNPRPTAAPPTTAPHAADDHDDHADPDHAPGGRFPAGHAKHSAGGFGPEVAVIADFRGNLSTDNANPARNRWDVGSIELDFHARLDPRADAIVALPIVREVEDPLFARSFAGAETGVETAIELEEAYLYLHDFGVPGLTARLGRFHLRFGRQNLLHLHDLPTVDNSFVNQSFLGFEALSDAGLSLGYVIPPQFTGGHRVQATAEIITGEGGGDEAPVVNNDAGVDGPAVNLHLLGNTRLSTGWNVELGTSWLTASRNDDNRQNANLFGLDATLTRTDPTGGFNNQLVQAEAIYGAVDTSRADTEYAFGAYVLAQQQFGQDLFAGLRLDWTQNATDPDQEVWGVSPYVTWYWNDALRFRLQYQHKAGDARAENTLYFQATFTLGGHPPHP
jgi:hypothetical protein